jgi:branched-chain amino acid transport system permease protein
MLERLRSRLRGDAGSVGTVRAGSTLLVTVFLIAVIVLVVVFYTATGTSYSIYLVDAILLASIGAIALDLLMGTGGQVSIGNSAFLATGGFATVWASRAGVSFPFDVVVGAFACAIGGFIVGLPALRIRGMYLALATLAAFYIATFIGTQYQTNTVGAGGFFLEPVFGGTLLQQHARWAWLLTAVLVATIVLAAWLRSGRSGRAWRMIRDHEVAASTMGIPVARYKLILFIISSALIGIQGGLFAHFTSSVSADTYTLSASIAVIAMILIGGLDSQAGPLIGALIVTMLPIVVPDILDALVSANTANNDAAGYAQVVYGALIMIFIIAAPLGIVGLLGALRRRSSALIRKSSLIKLRTQN